jgi:hypothetical protein
MRKNGKYINAGISGSVVMITVNLPRLIINFFSSGGVGLFFSALFYIPFTSALVGMDILDFFKDTFSAIDTTYFTAISISFFIVVLMSNFIAGFILGIIGAYLSKSSFFDDIKIQ